MANKLSCPALLVAAGSSDSGKTTVVAAMARYWRNQGKRVRVFKCGPDFIDPKFHEQASGNPAHQLDLGMMGESACRRHLAEAAKEADLILVEGVMGLFDGKRSSAEFAIQFGLPVLAVINGAKMAQTFGAIAYGLANFDSRLNLYGVVANQVGSPGHAKLLASSVPQGITFAGALPRDEALALPDRHLGLVQAQEIPGLDEWLETAAAKLADSVPLTLPPPVSFESVAEDTAISELGQPLQGKTIAVANDAAFAFIYQDNLNFLTQMGAKLRFFSPLAKQRLPQCDALYLPGGYPELHLKVLSEHDALIEDIQAHVNGDKPALAECGGMLYLLNQLTTVEGQCHQLAGVIPGQAQMQKRLAAIGMMSAELTSGFGGERAIEAARGHSFHFSKSNIDLKHIATAQQNGIVKVDEPVYRHHRLLASYVHWYLPSAPRFFVSLFLGEEIIPSKVADHES
ncbi:cobyrinate a,c-diamide synthase [Ferrimonas aestuarii]|uniref:Cobyrinate a,c-diamide synthase n=1 Tax=Ferrimonas aestuarii TaxID=2569539 RepID=A0A4U1BJ11_9GAMM|nr:cobyrinate a,c-diamide synthase [Ferrimonas aestuarii]TKB50068.1 cobyrinate a,c-diamide synthase [Ferrimonas aestuarii]